MIIKKFESYTNIPKPIIVSDDETKIWISNSKFKSINSSNINKILKSVYQPIGNWKRKHMFGVMDLSWDDERWSLLNRINTNYSALRELINGVNEVLIKGNSNVELFDLVTPEFGSDEFYKEYNRFIAFITRNKNNIFLKTDKSNGSSIINNIIKIINFTKSKGDKAEKVVVDNLSKIFGDGVSDIRIPDGSGDKVDMLSGVDISFNLNGIKKTIQVKKIKFIKKINNSYLTNGASISKFYTTDYYAVLTNSFLFFFNNYKEYIDLIDGELMFDKRSIIKIIKYKK